MTTVAIGSGHCCDFVIFSSENWPKILLSITQNVAIMYIGNAKQITITSFMKRTFPFFRKVVKFVKK
jgi:hypothetical protein